MIKITSALFFTSALLFGAYTPQGIRTVVANIEGETFVFDKMPDEGGIFPVAYKNIGPFMTRGFDKISEDSTVLLVDAGLPKVEGLWPTQQIETIADEADMEDDISPEKADVIIEIQLYAVQQKNGVYIKTHLSENLIKSSADHSSEMNAASSLKSTGHTNAGNAVAGVAATSFVLDLLGAKTNGVFKLNVKPKNSVPYSLMIWRHNIGNLRLDAISLGKVIKYDLLKD